MKQWYEQLYEDFDAYGDEPYTQATISEVDFIESVLESDRSKRILDVGCGNGPAYAGACQARLFRCWARPFRIHAAARPKSG